MNNKIQKNNEVVATAESNLQYWISKLNNMEKALSATASYTTPPAPLDSSLEAAIDTVMETALPVPPTWRSENANVQWVNAAECLSEAQLKQMVLNGEVATAIADAGASSSCGIPVSMCGGYKLKSDPFTETGRKSNKTFQYAGGGLAPATEIRELPYDVRGEAKEVHITPGIKNNLISTNKFATEGYVHVFDEEEVNVYDANDVEIKTTRGAILRGWRVPEQGLWRFPLVKGAQKI